MRSTDFAYSLRRDSRRSRVIRSIRSCCRSPRPGYRARRHGGYLSQVAAAARVRLQRGGRSSETVQSVDADSLENLPIGLDGAAYQWVDLDGEGVSGILTEQAGAWFYKRNLSPVAPSSR